MSLSHKYSYGAVVKCLGAEYVGVIIDSVFKL